MRIQFVSPAQCVLIVSVLIMPFHALAAVSDVTLEQGLSECASGSYAQALSNLQTAYDKADQPAVKIKAASALAQAYIQMHRAVKAEPYLAYAFDHASNKLDKAGYAIDFGNWQQQQGHAEQARYYYDTALQLAGTDTAIAISAGLNQQKLEAKKQTPAVSLKNLQQLWQLLLQGPLQGHLQAGEYPQAARYSLNLGNLAGKDGSSSMVVVRLNADGTPDRSFAPHSGGAAAGSEPSR